MLLLYGANGYSGRLIAEEAVAHGLRPVLAGRRREGVEPIASALGLEYRVFGLDDAAEVARGLEGVGIVLHAAGPFALTSEPMVNGCLGAHAHYLDITGEISVFERCRARDGEARAAGIVVMPGVGFDVVPTDCLAVLLRDALPSATHLELAFHGSGGPSPGTAKTMLLGIGHGAAVREEGRIRTIPLGSRTATVPFRDRPRLVVAIGWGDVSTARHSTGIPNIVTYLGTSRGTLRTMRVMRWLRPVLATGPVQRAMMRRVERTVTGPDAEARRTRETQVWGRVRDAAGRSVEGTAVVPNGYRFTALAAVECARRVLASAPAPGYHTPTSAFGPGLLASLPDCSVQVGTVREGR
jgi:short subunit dehydrogenase-like uncharacterized protein